jgi:hypothetical protein
MTATQNLLFEQIRKEIVNQFLDSLKIHKEIYIKLIRNPYYHGEAIEETKLIEIDKSELLFWLKFKISENKTASAFLPLSDTLLLL